MPEARSQFDGRADYTNDLPLTKNITGWKIMSQAKTGIAKAREQVAKIIDDVDSLPSLPSIVMKLIEVVNAPDSSAEDAAALIQQDPALTSKMIRLANSAFYGIPRSVSSVTSAVVALGFNTIRTLVLGASVAQIFDGKHSLDMDRFWKHSVVTAMASKAIVRHLMGVRVMDPETAFCAGILHDIGKLILSQYMPGDYGAICNAAKERGIPIVDAENMVLGINHAQIGKILSDKWTLPPVLEYAIVGHHALDSLGETSHMANVVHLANIMAHDLGCNQWDGEACVPENPNCRTELKIGDADYEKIIYNLEISMEKSHEFLAVIR
jgi:putative nucleotidyltransferase with HDIG domain